MRYILLAISFSVILGSCKLMKKDDEKEIKTKNKNSSTMISRYKPVEWSHTTNIYEVNLRQYTPEGTFMAFAKHLPRLKDMGVKTLWFMPITPIAQKNKKGSLGSYYACSDYTSVNAEFGTLSDFKNLVSEAHTLGFNIIIDWVANHTGWDHKWTTEHPDYYLKDPVTHNFKMASGMDDIIELDYKNPELRKAMISAMKYWVTECDIDGFRCDLASWVEIDFWREARKAVDEVKPLFWLGEFDELQDPHYGEAFDASYSWAWMHRSEDFYKKQQPFDSLYALLKRYDDLGDSTMRTWFTTNHDENSWNGTEYDKYGDLAKALAVFSATWNGVPLIYSGQEIPNKKKLLFFEKDVIDWSGKNELHDFYKTLFTLKTNNPALRAGDIAVQTFNIKTTDDEKIFAYLRKNGSKEVFVIINMSPGKISNVQITDANITGTFKNIFSATTTDFINKNFEMQPWQYLVYEK